MKPPRVVSHKGYFYIVYYLPGEKHAVKEPVGVKLDIERGTGDWWKKSKHRAKIKIVLEDALTRKLRYKQGHEFERRQSRIALRSLEDLLAEYNDEQRIAKGADASPDTLAKRRNAVKALQRFVPKASIRLSRKMAAAFRDDALGELEAETVRSYVTFLRSLFTFAVDKGYVAANPFHKISVSVSEKEVRHIDRTDQVRVFDELFHTRRDVFWQVMFIRLSGYRVSEAGSLETTDVRTDRIATSKVKMKGRIDVFPRTEPINIILEHKGRFDPFVFRFRRRDGITLAIRRVCKKLGIPGWGSHQLKRDYALEVAPLCRGDAYLKNLMLHHRSKWMTMVADTRYIGHDLELMKETAEKAQEFWTDYLKNRVTELGSPAKNRYKKQGNNKVTAKRATANH